MLKFIGKFIRLEIFSRHLKNLWKSIGSSLIVFWRRFGGIFMRYNKNEISSMKFLENYLICILRISQAKLGNILMYRNFLHDFVASQKSVSMSPSTFNSNQIRYLWTRKLWIFSFFWLVISIIPKTTM